METLKKLLRFMTLLSLGLLFSFPSHGNSINPRVSILSPISESIVKGQVEIQVEVADFADLTVAFAYFAYSRDGKHFKRIGYDRNSFDGFSIKWDTSKCEDGKYLLKVMVTDTFGNKASAQTWVVINNHLPERSENIHSITDELIKNVGTDLVQVGAVLGFSKKEDDLFALLNKVSAKIKEAGQILGAAARRLVNFRADLPEAFLQVAQIEKSQTISASFDNLAILFDRAAESIKTLDNGDFKKALEDIRSEISCLANITLAGIELTPLRLARKHLDKVLFLSKELDQLVAQSDQRIEKSKLDSLVGEFEAAFFKISQVFKETGRSISESAPRKAAKFTSSTGEPINSYTQGQKLILEIAGVKDLKFQLFDAGSRLVFSKSIFGHELIWSGLGCNGRMLPVGLYYYQLSFIHQEDRNVEIGWLTISPK